MKTKPFASMCIGLHLMTALFIALPTQAETDSRIELTPTIGYRFGGEFDNDPLFFDFDFSPEVQDSESYGLTLGIGLTPHWTLEFLYDHQESELVDHSFFIFPGEADLWSRRELRPCRRDLRMASRTGAPLCGRQSRCHPILT